MGRACFLRLSWRTCRLPSASAEPSLLLLHSCRAPALPHQRQWISSRSVKYKQTALTAGSAQTRLFGHLLATLFSARATSNVAAVLQRAAVPAGKAALCAPCAPGSWGHVVQLCSFAWLPSRMVHSVAKARAAPLLLLVQRYEPDKRNALCYTLSIGEVEQLAPGICSARVTVSR